MWTDGIFWFISLPLALFSLLILLTMTGFTVNPYRSDPYKNFKFRVKWDGRYILGIDRITGLRRETGVVQHRDGGDPSAVHRMPGITQYEPIVLERGRTHDTAFEAWADLVFNFGAGPGAEMSLRNFRKDIEISLLNEAGQLAMTFRVYRCWPSVYEPLANLDGSGEDIMRERIVLQHEGWERDTEVAEPAEV
jgi:phage tail-like protein